MARPFIGGTNAAIKTLTATQSLSSADTGKIFICSQASDNDITLPAVGDAKGWTGTFFLGTAGGHHFDIIGGTVDVMRGVDVGDTNVVIDAADKVTFVASTAVVGERVDIFCDGTNYYVTTYAVADTAITSEG
tara:strand:+ start:4468 stop:4866 length:399 start_codon:yes stop_codon:yes gene_type:complete